MVPAGRVLMRVPASRKYVMAARAIQGAWRHRRTIKRTAKMIYRYGKRRKTKYGKRSMPNVKQSSQASGDAIPVVSSPAATGFNMGSLQIQSLPWPSFGDGLRERERNVIRFKGVKICRLFEYATDKDSAFDIGPIELHWALVQFKDPQLLTTDLSILNDTFRTFESDTTKSQNFPTYSAASNWDMTLNCAPLNPEKWKVLTHKRFALCAQDNSNNAAGRMMLTTRRGPHYVKIEKYYKFNKSLNFRNTSDGVPDNNIVELYWYNTISPRGFPADPAATKYINTHKAHIIYFSDKGIRS